jgi:hypothetical protein
MVEVKADVKVKKTADMKKYQKEYQEANKERILNKINRTMLKIGMLN